LTAERVIDVEMIFAVSPPESQRTGRLASCRRMAFAAAVVGGAVAVATLAVLTLALH